VTRRQSTLLIAAGLWTVYVWISFVVIQTRQDTSVGFKVVHGVLALISMAFGIAVGIIGWRAKRAAAAASNATSDRVAEPVVSARP
jgi:hypothetical protein